MKREDGSEARRLPARDARSLAVDLTADDLGKRILVTGNAGSGKTTLAAELGARLDAPVFGLDAIVWQPRWRKTQDVEKHERIAALVDHPTWIIDGVSTPALVVADTVIFLDVPRLHCYVRVAKRNVPYLFRSRPGLPKNCPEILVVHKLAKIIWNFETMVRPTILANAARRQERGSFIHVG